MARDDHDRRRLRALYDRHKSRTLALAEARDRRRDAHDDVVAPRRVVVSAQRLREAGFGRGGTQVRVVRRRRGRRQHGDPRSTPGRALRFADRHIFRSSHQDRFRRDDDMERELRRERAILRERQSNGRGGQGAGGFGISRRRRLRMRMQESTRRSRQGGNQVGQPQRNRAGQRSSGRGQPQPQQQQQQKQPQRHQRGQQPQQQGGRGDRSRNDNGSQPSRQRSGQRPRSAAPMPTHEQLNAQLDSYRNG